jgi:hypothetical protein
MLFPREITFTKTYLVGISAQKKPRDLIDFGLLNARIATLYR